MFSLSTNLLITLHHQDLRLLYRYHPVLDHRGRPPALLPNHQWVASWILLKINVLITEILTYNTHQTFQTNTQNVTNQIKTQEYLRFRFCPLINHHLFHHQNRIPMKRIL